MSIHDEAMMTMQKGMLNHICPKCWSHDFECFAERIYIADNTGYIPTEVPGVAKERCKNCGYTRRV